MLIEGVQCIALNFGRWESRDHKNAHALDCHAHAHVIFTKKGIENLSAKVDIFIGRTDPPPDYTILDCEQLERERIMALQVLRISQRLDEVQETQKEMLAALGKLLTLEEKKT